MFAFARSLLRPTTFPELVSEYYASQAFRSLSPSSQTPYRGVIDRLARDIGDRSLRSLSRRDMECVLAQRSPGAANDTLKKLRILARFAMERGYRRDDPTFGIRRFPAGEGHHTWNEAEIAQFEGHWPVGTRERLAFGLLIFTGQRRSDVVRMAWSDLAANGNALVVTQRKTATKLIIPVHTQLATILAAVERRAGAILQTPFGKAFTAGGFGNWMADRIESAGLSERCVAHGLRKAAARRLAECGATTREIAAITGHRTLREIERYTEAASQERLAGQAMARLERP